VALNEAMLMAIAAWPTQRGQRKPSGQRAFFMADTATQKPKGYTLLLGAVQPPISDRKAFLDRVTGHT
jgi:hypothetical protein